MRMGPSFKKPMIFLTDETLKIAPVLKETPPVSAELVGKWVAHWKKTGFVY